MGRRLVEMPELVRGKQVLEIGSGCGLCGILAAKLGAREVTCLHDYADPLPTLLLCLHAFSHC